MKYKVQYTIDIFKMTQFCITNHCVVSRAIFIDPAQIHNSAGIR